MTFASTSIDRTTGTEASVLQMRYATNMRFTIDEVSLPATLTARPMTDQQFADFCAEHPDLFFETNARGEIIVMAPSFSITGARNCEITMQLGIWAMRDARGIASDSSAGFLLPNGARRSPDASWTPKDEIRKLSTQAGRVTGTCVRHS